MRNLLYSKVFISGLIVRIVLMPLFGSHYLRELFTPFVDTAILNLGVNPWSLLPSHYFPYGSFLFILLFIPKFIFFLIFGESALGNTFLSLFLMKTPLLLLDFILLLTLMKVAKLRAEAILVFYWLNPIAIYITYIHGQLDVAAMSLALLSTLLLIYRRTLPSAIFLALATLCKFHVVALIPLFLIYEWNQKFSKEAIRSIVSWSLFFIVITALGFLPLLSAHKLSHASVSSPEAFRVFSAKLDFGSDQVIYFGVLLVLTVLGRLCISTRITDKGLLFGSGMIFSALLLGTNTMPGWYYWVLPYYSLFFALYLNISSIIFWVFNFLYLLYFGVIQDFSLISGMPKGVVFTLLQTTLAGISLVIWRLVIIKEAVLQGRARPTVLGIAGNSGAGKNYLSHILKDIFNPKKTILIEGDDYHKWERQSQRWNDYTHLNPRANNLKMLAEHTHSLSEGSSIVHSSYDHSTGTFDSPKEIKPNKTVIIQGLHTLYLKGMRSKIDLKIFLSPEESLRLAWKINRDVKERGKNVPTVVESLKERENDGKLHIDPQKKHADWIIEYFSDKKTEDLKVGEFSQSSLSSPLNVRYILWNDAPVSDLVDILREYKACDIELNSLPEDSDRIVVTIKGNPEASLLENIAEILFPNIRHITKGWEAPNWHSGLNGISQLFATALLKGKLLEES